MSLNRNHPDTFSIVALFHFVCANYASSLENNKNYQKYCYEVSSPNLCRNICRVLCMKSEENWKSFAGITIRSADYRDLSNFAGIMFQKFSNDCTKFG